MAWVNAYVAHRAAKVPGTDSPWGLVSLPVGQAMEVLMPAAKPAKWLRQPRVST